MRSPVFLHTLQTHSMFPAPLLPLDPVNLLPVLAFAFALLFFTTASRGCLLIIQVLVQVSLFMTTSAKMSLTPQSLSHNAVSLSPSCYHYLRLFVCLLSASPD